MADSELGHVTLYWLNQSRSQRIVWLLEELKIPYSLEVFHRDKTTFLAPKELEAIHPLGKSPVIKIQPPNGGDPVTLAESGWMTQYLVEHCPEGQRLMPKRWKDGMENKMCGETEGWLRYMYFMHYCEGSLMPIMVMTIIINRLKSPQVPFFVRPITTSVANKIFSAFIFPNARKHMAMIDGQLKSAPEGGPYLCGKHLTAADILMSFPLIASRGRLDDIGNWKGGSWATEFPRVDEYVKMLENEEGYKQSVKKVEEVEGKFEASL